MGERLADRREKGGMNRNTLRMLGILLLALGLFGRGILQNRVLGMQSGGTGQLLELLDQSGGMAAATVALVLEAVESCAVPIFAVLTVDGFQRTGSFRKYLLRVLAMAAVSEIPYNFALTGRLWDTASRNPAFGLVLALAMLYLFQNYEGTSAKNVAIKIAVGGAALLWAVLFQVKFGVMMLLVVGVLWIFRRRHTLSYLMAAAAAISCCVGNPLYMFAPFGFLLVHFYNGEEGNTNRVMQYGVYPLLLVLVGLAGVLLF